MPVAAGSSPRLGARRAPGWPLAVTLGVHVLLAWCWLQASSLRMLPVDGRALREFFVVPVRVPVLVPAPAVARTDRGATRTAPVAALRVAPSTEPQAIATPPAPTMQPAAPAIASEPATDVFALPQPAAQDGATSGDDSLAGRAKSSAGATDHELRKGKLAPLDPGDSKWHRFSQAVGSARIDKSRTLTSESYTTPDGVTIYRFRQGGRTYCRTGGNIKPSPFGAEGGGAALFDKAGGDGFAGIVTCPIQAEFKRD